jgi:DNA polymerase III subunit delta
MIVKSFEIDKLKIAKQNFFLFYGENEGLKNQTIQNLFKKKFDKNIYKYDEKEVLENKNNFIENISTKSFFDNERLIIISRTTDKIINFIEEIIEENIEDIKIILNSDILEKKSKLRTLFEKNKKTICVPFYADNNQTLNSIVNNFFREKKMPISQELINLLVNRSRGDRQNIKNELNKIENYIKNKKNIITENILKLTNLAENYDVGELIDSLLNKNLKKTSNILNENNYSGEDCILIIRTLLNKSKRLLKLYKQINKGNNIDQVISLYKPPIFWKDKEVVKEQVKNWSLEKIENLIYETNEIELLVKKNSINSLNILSDFIMVKSNKFNK